MFTVKAPSVWISLAITSMSFLIGTLRASGASTSTLDRATLKGVDGFDVLVECLTSDIDEKGLSRQQIQTDVELRLRKAGIKILTEEEAKAANVTSFLSVNVTVGGSKDIPGLYVFSIGMKFCQVVRLTRDPSIIALVATWSTGGIGTVGGSNFKQVRDHLGDAVDKFANDFLAANPPPKRDKDANK